jgi:hypothetical protein
MATTIRNEMRPIAVAGPHGVDYHYPILPNQWKGETDCIVGPFSGEDVAQYFANYAVDFGHYESFSYRVFPKRNEWYVEINGTAQRATSTLPRVTAGKSVA